MIFGVIYLSLDTIQAFKEFLLAVFCFVLPRAFCTFSRVAFIRTNISKVIKHIAMKILLNKVPIIHLTPVQTHKN